MVILSQVYRIKLASSLIYEAKLGYIGDVSAEISSIVGILIVWHLLSTEIVFKHHFNAPCSLTD